MFIAGGSGNGKSKLLELLLLQLATQGCGYTFVDPHGDLAKSLRDQLIRLGVPPEDILYLEPTLDGCFSIDPAASIPLGSSQEEYEQKLSVVVDRVAKAFLRVVAAADQDVMNRLKRWLKNVLYACLVRLDDQNTHLGLDKALLLLAPQRPEFTELYAKVRDHLPEDVRADFEKLIATPRARDQEAWVESTINRLRDILSPIVKLIFGQHAPSVDFAGVLRGRKIVLLNLGEHEISREQGNVIGGLFISLLVAAARSVDQESERVFHLLVIDEAENFIGEDLRMGFAELRKFLLSVVIIVQDLSCLKRGELDLVGKVVSQCGVQATFQQMNPDDVEMLGKAFLYGFADFTPHMTNEVLPDGFDWHATQSVSIGASASRSQSTADSLSVSHTESTQLSTARSIQEQVSQSVSVSESDGAAESLTRGEAQGRARGVQLSHSDGTSAGWSAGTNANRTASTNWSDTAGDSSSDTHGLTRAVSFNHADSVDVGDHSGRTTLSCGSSEATAINAAHGSSTSTSQGGAVAASQGTSQTINGGENSSDTVGVTNTVNDTASTTVGKTHSHGVGKSAGLAVARGIGATHGLAQGVAAGLSLGKTTGVTDGAARNLSVTFGTTPLARHKITRVPSGKLLTSISDQLAKRCDTIAGLPDRTVLFKIKGMRQTFLVRVHDVPTVAVDDAVVKSFLEQMRVAHSCFFSPRKTAPSAAHGPRDHERGATGGEAAFGN